AARDHCRPAGQPGSETTGESVAEKSRARPKRRFPPQPIVQHNEERFSLTGAAREPLREDSIGGFRAGERETYWTKPLPPAPGLWALNGRGCIAGARLRRC